MSTAELNAELITASPAPSDPELIERFVGARDQLALAELVRRHSPVVLGVCRRVLRDNNDIEDAFQATFLVLIRDARLVRKQTSLASWLYGVAYRLSLQLTRQKRRRRETTLVDDNLIDCGILATVADRHDHQLLDAELNTLPERYRQPLVLRYLAGKSSSEVATELGLTIGTVDGLLKRGKDELRQRLLKRGVTIGAALAAIQLTQESACAVAAETLIESTIQAGLAWDPSSHKFLPDQLSNGQISTRALELAGKDVLIMTTGTKSVLTIGLTLGGLFAAAGGISQFENSPQGRAEASGLIDTVSIAHTSPNAINITTLTGAPIAVADSKPAEIASTLNAEDKTNHVDPVRKPDSDANVVQARQPGHSKWELTHRGPRTQKIMNTLSVPAEANFVDVPLKEAMEVFQENHQIEISLDQRRLGDEGISTDQPVTLQTAGPNLKSVLRMMLDPLDLDYIVENEVLTITTRTHANETYDTRVYRLEGIRDHFGQDEIRDELTPILRLTIQPDSWKRLVRRMPAGMGAGGAAGAVAMGGAVNQEKTHEGEQAGPSGEGSIMNFGNMLIIRQTHRVHEEIVDFLDQLQAQFANDEANRVGGGLF